MRMIPRNMRTELKLQSEFYPVVSVMGPRQSGKTTLVKMVFPQKVYVNLENPSIRALAFEDPEAFFAQYPSGAILDEIQRVPSLLSYIQVIVDQTDHKGMFILTGSHQLELHQEISQSLAGRVSLLKLLPLSIGEIRATGIEQDTDDYLYKGFYPGIYQNTLSPTRAYQNYLETYVEKDIRQLIHVKDITLFEKFIKLCAGRIGQVFVSSQLANEIGVSYHTINHWLSILEASFIVFRLPPYFENFGKRIIKAPKLYFTDVGFASFLLDIEQTKEIRREPLRGFLFENLVILELVKARLNQGLHPKIYFYRDSQKNEVDVIFKTGSKLTAIEIKSAQTYHKTLLKGLKKFESISKDRLTNAYLIYAGVHEQTNQGIAILNYHQTANIVKS